MSKYGYIAHHGIKGQKWGVRNGPPYPIEDKVLKKGTVLGNVSAYKDPIGFSSKNKRWMYFYNPNDEWDKKVYEGPFSYYLKKRYRQYGDVIIKKYRYETVRDLKMPTYKERIDLFKDLLNGPNGQKYFDEMTKHNDWRKNNGYKYAKSLPASNLYFGKTKNVSNFLKQKEDDIKEAYQWAFGSLMEDISQYKFAQEYANKISEKYDAMVDDNNVNKYNNVHDPIIIFKVESAIRKLDEGRENTWDDIAKGYAEVSKKLGRPASL